MKKQSNTTNKCYRFVLVFVFCLFNGALHTYSKENIFTAFTHSNQYLSFKNIYLPIESNIINIVFQDNTGMMWIGTKRGLFTYNGYQIYKLSIDPTIEYINVTTILQLNEQYLCIGTDRGLRFFNLLTEQFENLHPATQCVKSVRSMILWDNKLWLGTNKEGLIYYDLQNRIIHPIPVKSVKSKSIVYAFEPADSKLYIGAYDGLSCYDPQKQERELVPLPQQFQKLMVNSLLWDEEQACLWIGTEGHLFHYNIQNHHITQPKVLPSNSFKTLAFDNKKNLVTGTDNGLYIYDLKLNKVNHIFHDSRNEHSLSNNVIWCSYVDKNNNIWLGTDYGVSLLVDNSSFQFIHLSELTGTGNGNEFTHILKDSQGYYWLGGTNGILLFDKTKKVKWFNTENPQYPLIHNQIRRIYEDRTHTIWIATDGGVARYDCKQEKFIYYTIIDTSNQRKAKWAYDIYDDELGYLWIATYLGGVFIIDKKELLSHDSKTPFYATWNLAESDVKTKVSDIAYQLQADKYGTIWINTQDGLVRIDCKSKEIRKLDIYLDNMIYDGLQSLWYSSNNILYKMDVSTCTIEKIEELPLGSQIHSFVLENNNIWISCTGGLKTWNLNTLYKTDVTVFEQYYQSGFYDKEFNIILWGGYDGISYLSTNTLQKVRNTNQTIITSIVNNNKRLLPKIDYEGNSIRYQNNIELPYTKRNLTFELSTFTYNSGTDNGFYYRFENEIEWNKLGSGQNRISFVNLYHGKYKLFIRTGNSEDSKISPITEFEFTILPPWYASTVAYILYSIVFIFIILTTIKYIRSNIKKKYERIEKEKTLELSNLKMDFFVHISHELKTPLSLIIAPLSTLIAETKKVEYKNKLETIYKNALKLNILIHKVLDFKEINHEEGSILIRSNIELCSLMKDILSSYSTALSQKNIQAILTSKQEHIWMSLDRIKIESVFSNIITNAIKYSPTAGGRIDISIVTNDKSVVIQISDTGNGIKKEDLPYVFVRYFQSMNKAKRKDGSGIGLYIVKKFIELHGGQVEINSEGENHGTLVTVSLPIFNETIIQSDEKIYRTVPQDSYNDKLSTLLIIDDNPETLTFLGETFSKDYHCLYASNGKEGLAIAIEHRPSIVIVDQLMPEMDGIELSKRLKDDPRTSIIPIIMLTAKDDKETKLKSISAGIDVFISKPFDVYELKLRMQQLLSTRNTMERKLKIDAIGQSVQLENKKPDMNEVFMEQLASIIEENIENSEFNVSMLCTLLKMDNKQLCRKTKLLTGATPVDLIRRIRMRKAAVLLSQKRFTVSEVMYMVGYTNASYFSKCFMQEYKVVPSQYNTPQ